MRIIKVLIVVQQLTGSHEKVNQKHACLLRKNFNFPGLVWYLCTSVLNMLLHINYHCFFKENLAFGKPTDQWKGQYRDGKSSKAVDGNSDTDFKFGAKAGSCSLTDKSNKPWWRVDLQQVEHVSEVYIVNRGSECDCRDRFKNFEIKVGRLNRLQHLVIVQYHTSCPAPKKILAPQAKTCTCKLPCGFHITFIRGVNASMFLNFMHGNGFSFKI